eukprot:6455025-Amphidinium_carterae.1
MHSRCHHPDETSSKYSAMLKLASRTCHTHTQYVHIGLMRAHHHTHSIQLMSSLYAKPQNISCLSQS